MKILKSISVWLLAISLFSCNTGTDPAPIPNPDGPYLSKIYMLDSISPVQTDTSGLSVFQYDNQKRVVKLTYYTSIGQLPEYYTDYYYTGTSPVCYKSITTTLPSESDTAYYFYNAEFEVIKDSTCTAYDIAVKKYVEINGGWKNFYSYNGYNGSNFYDTTTVMMTKVNGHVVREEYIKSWGSDEIVEYEYDNGINPFKIIRFTTRPYHFNYMYGMQGNDENNITRFFHIGRDVVQSYTYKANGLPSFMRVSFDGDPVWMYSFHYTD